MRAEDVANRLKKVTGVHEAVTPSKEVLDKAFSMEDCVEDSTFGMPIENRALAECRKRDACVCVFCDYSFEQPTDHVMTMEDDSGRMVGYDIPAGMQADYVDREGLIWVSEDFVIEEDGDATKVVMLPQKTVCIGEGDGVRDAVIFYPATTTDQYLRAELGYGDGDPKIATAFVAFNWAR